MLDDKGNFFNLFSLPPELIVFILKNYISVLDKVYILSEIPEFASLLMPSSSWYKSSFNFANLIRFVKPGWYIDMRFYNHMYYLSLNEEHQTVIIHHFNCKEQIKYSKRKMCQTSHVTRCNAEKILKKFVQKFSFINELYVYSVGFTFFSVLMPQNVIYWWKDNTFHPIENNKCKISTACENFEITIFNDKNHTIGLKCSAKFMIVEPRKFLFSTENDQFGQFKDAIFETSKVTLKSVDSQKIMIKFENFGKNLKTQLLHKVIGTGVFNNHQIIS